MSTRFEDGSVAPSSLKPVSTASTRTGTCTVGEVTWNAKQKKSRSGRAPHPTHRSMHLIVLSTRFAGLNREVDPFWFNVPIQGWSVRVVSGRGTDLCFAIDSVFEPVAARLKPTLNPMHHTSLRWREAPHPPTGDGSIEERQDLRYRTPPTLATFFSQFSSRKVWTFPVFDSMIRPFSVVPFLG